MYRLKIKLNAALQLVHFQIILIHRETLNTQIATYKTKINRI